VTEARPLDAVLFDLDGTLLDTAPDMVAALNELRREKALDPLDYDYARAHVSNGALGLLKIGFDAGEGAHGERLRERFLEIYAGRLATSTRLFQGMETVLAHLEAAGLRWGVVTNKPGHLTRPLLQALDLARRCACIVSGDTLTERKPHPGPLLHAAALMSVPRERAMYVGDAARDIEAGRAAGMMTVAAVYGYIPPGEDPAAWQADHAIEQPDRLSEILSGLGFPGPGR